MNKRARVALASALSAVIVAASAAAPALADTDDIRTANAYWSYVDDSAPYISDAESYYPNLLGTGVELPFGWTGDTFDGFLSDITLDGSTVDFVSAAGGAGWVDGGLSSFAYTGTAPGFDPAAEISATLEIQGNYARWTFTQVAGPTGTLRLSGNLGSDGYQTATVVAPNAAVVSSDDNEADPVIGYWFSGAAGTLSVPSSGAGDYVVFTATTSSPATAVVALQDYAPCGEDRAVADMVSLVPTLNSSFGQSIDGELDCASVVAPAQLAIGSATSQRLAVTIDPAVDAWLDSPWAAESLPGYLDDPTIVGSAFVGGPAGTAYAFDPATSEVTISGAPTEAGTFDVALVLYITGIEDYIRGEEGNAYPLVARFTVTVAEPALAATGLSDVTPAAVVFAALFLISGTAMVWFRRRFAL